MEFGLFKFPGGEVQKHKWNTSWESQPIPLPKNVCLTQEELQGISPQCRDLSQVFEEEAADELLLHQLTVHFES